MNIFKAICFGVILWVADFVIISVCLALNVYDNPIIKLADVLIIGFISLALIFYLRPKYIGVSLVYGIIWVGVAVILDLVVAWRFESIIFYDWSVWMSYIFILIAAVLGYYSLENGNDEVKEKNEPEPPQDIKL